VGVQLVPMKSLYPQTARIRGHREGTHFRLVRRPQQVAARPAADHDSPHTGCHVPPEGPANPRYVDHVEGMVDDQDSSR
jgi:hypothetical protein